MEKWLSYCIGCSVAFVFIAFIVGIFMFLWNWIMPYMFNLPTIDFWMALGIVVLLSFFGSNSYPQKK